ncbi:uracil-DNA glycosylase [Serpentinimonas maccroryi]|nr:uracil-DNA glycosylase [Serpentinimonas maccroryi]
MGVRPWWLFGAQTEVAPAPAPQTAPARPAHRAEPAAVPVAHPAVAPSARAPAPAPAPAAAPATTPPAPAPDWDALEQQIRSCQRCPLGAQRQCAVPGMGDRRPDWLLVGEAPGEEEDRQGLPFVGRAGQLLDRMLAALQLQRTQRVHITNVIKCRPPQNRNPAADEIAHCAPYLRRQIELLQPKIVLALGRFAAQTLLAEGGCLSPDELHTLPLGKLRGRIYQARIGAQTLPLVVTYHPAYLLRSPADKARAWADLCLAADALEAAAST